MTNYNIEVNSSVVKELKKIPNEQINKILKEIEKLKSEPFPINKYKKLKGTDKSYRLRIGNYKVLYEIENEINYNI